MPAQHRHLARLDSKARVLLSAVVGWLLLGLVGTAIAPVAVLAETPGSTASPSPDPLAPTPVPAASLVPVPTGPTPIGETVTFHGRGYGHGVGLSQYGARGRALDGEDSTTILAHYYQGATISAIDPASRIRVLVLSKWAATAEKPLVIYGRLGTWSIDGVTGELPGDARLRLFPPLALVPGTVPATGSPWRLMIEATDGTVLFDGPAPTDFTIRGVSAESRLQLWSKPTRYDRYRGSLRVIVHSASRVSVVNDLPLEEYLAGVVPVEMPSSWPAAALEAQSIAARSYAARRLRPGVSYFDVPDDSTSQIYRGVLAEKPATTTAIAATAGAVLVSGPSIINALFHSTGGGATESNENVYTSSTGKRIARPVSYLRGASDRRADGSPFDAGAPYAAWASRTYTRAQLSAIFAADARTNVGELLALDLTNRGVSGRLVSVTLVGTLRTRTVSGEVFRSAFNARRPKADPTLKSTLLDTAPIP